MSELVSVQPCKPGSGDLKFSGLSGVFYDDHEHELCIFFAVTLRVCLSHEGKLVFGTMEQAERLMQDYCTWHAEGKIQIDPACFWRDPADQRPVNEQTARNAYGSDPQPAPDRTTPDGKPVKSFECAKVEKERDPKNKKTYIGFYMPNHKYPDVKVTTDNDGLWRKVCGQLSAITGFDWTVADLGTTSMVPMIVGYTDSDKLKANGNPYMNFYGVRAK